MKKIVYIFLMLAFLASAKAQVYRVPEAAWATSENCKREDTPSVLRKKALVLREWAIENAIEHTLFIMIDMSIHSGKNRLFVYDFDKDLVLYASLVSHGFGSARKSHDSLTFSNASYSFSTSLGKYVVGKPYKGMYGLSYRLYGMDSTNSNAFLRNVVLHGEPLVPEVPSYPLHIFESQGCPSVSPGTLAILKKYIESKPKPLLMYIYK